MVATPKRIEISTINVNGIRAAARKGLLEWLAESSADFVCLQEVRATAAETEVALAPALAAGWHLAHSESAIKGRAGVGVLSRIPAAAVRSGFLGGELLDANGRYLEADYGDMTVASVYVPTGDAGTQRQVDKEEFLDALAKHLATKQERFAVSGDWNIAHTELDLKAWKSNLKNSGFLLSERSRLDSLIGPAGPLVDVMRQMHPGQPGPYSWWSYRGRAFDNDAGWRIDCQYVTPDLAARATSGRVERAAAYDQRWSDHAPVTVSYG